MLAEPFIDVAEYITVVQMIVIAYQYTSGLLYINHSCIMNIYFVLFGFYIVCTTPVILHTIIVLISGIRNINSMAVLCWKKVKYLVCEN